LKGATLKNEPEEEWLAGPSCRPLLMTKGYCVHQPVTRAGKPHPLLTTISKKRNIESLVCNYVIIISA